MSERPYSRIYWEIMDDEKFDGIREDARTFGSWALLLVVADMAWPVPAFVPPTVPRKSVQILASRGLVDILAGGRFRIHGMAKERDMRTQSARSAAAVRWHGNGNAESMPRQDKTRQDEKRQDETTRGASDEAFETLGKIVLTPTPPMLRFLDELREEFGDRMTAWAIAQANADDSRDRRTLLSRAKRLLIEHRRSEEQAEADAEKARNAAKRQPVVIVPLPHEATPEQVAAEIEEYRRSKGKSA